MCTTIKNLNKGKLAGPDDNWMVANTSIFICLQHTVIPYLSKMLNDIFHTGWYPDLWAKSVIVQAYKKGGTNQT